MPMTLRVWRRAIWVLTQISRIRTPPSAMGAGVPQHMDKTSSNECLAPIRRWLSSSSPRGEVSATGRQAAQPIVNSTPTPDGRRARENLQKQAARHRAPPITTPPPVDGVISTPPAAFAKANTPSTTKHPYADCCRPRGCNRRPRRFHSLTTALVAQRPQTRVARRRGRRGCEQPRCARGNLKGRPQAWTKMTKGTSGANAPDRNRGRSQPRRPRRRATYEDLGPVPTKIFDKYLQRPRTYKALNPPRTPIPKKITAPH
ncbi:hypothetical protein D3C86_1485900 [compost metagenome]